MLIAYESGAQEIDHCKNYLYVYTAFFKVFVCVLSFYWYVHQMYTGINRVIDTNKILKIIDAMTMLIITESSYSTLQMPVGHKNRTLKLSLRALIIYQ